MAFVFADRAARTGLASAEFAMGYYWEVGIGTGKGVDLRKARRWYERVSFYASHIALNSLIILCRQQNKAMATLPTACKPSLSHPQPPSAGKITPDSPSKPSSGGEHKPESAPMQPARAQSDAQDQGKTRRRWWASRGAQVRCAREGRSSTRGGESHRGMTREARRGGRAGSSRASRMMGVFSQKLEW